MSDKQPYGKYFVVPDYKLVLRAMFELPWRNTGTRGDKLLHWGLWLLAWPWTIAGVALGAFVAPSLLQLVGQTHSPYQDFIVVVVAALAGFLVQFTSWLLVMPLGWLLQLRQRMPSGAKSEALRLTASLSLIFVVGPLPLVAVSYALYRYFTWLGPGQDVVTIGFVGGLFVKVVLVPVLKTFGAGFAFKYFLKWLRKNNPPASKPQ